MISIKNLSVKYKDNSVLNNIDLDLDSCKINFIVGRNGSGKSTLINAISGLKSYKGIISIDNNNIEKLNIIEMRKLIGVVFQNPTNQIVFNRVYDDIKFTLENMKVDKDKIDGIIRESLSKVGMLKFIDANPFSLSLGERQKIAIAGILALNPKYIVFDEATSFLDINSKRDIYKLMQNLKSQITFIFVTNIMDELIYADNVIIIDEGKAFKYSMEEILGNLQILKSHGLDIPFTLKVVDKYGYENVVELIND